MASMAVQTSSTSPPPPPLTHPIKYDVFLSFRGADTRTKFTDHLYNALQVREGIPTFRDSEELEKGQNLSQLFEAIEKSTIAVVILSSNYASSTWCLREVAKIVECRNKSGLIVLPVFYDIEPTQVRKQEGSFKNYFDEHEQKFKDSIGRVQTWRQALVEVATLVGWHLKDRWETEVIEEIVKEVDKKWKLKFSPAFSVEDSKNFVGMDRVREVELDLDIKGLDQIGVIGICGMPGVGKTTIAEVVFRRNWHHFEAHSFIANVGETRKKNGLLHIQNQLYHDLLGSKVITKSDVPAERRKLGHKKVLIILDGVTELDFIVDLVGRGGEELINWFGRGSRIIITTIDEKLLERYKAKIHKVERLDESEARLLFFRKAFNKDQPLHDFANLSNKFVDFADGLPLAIVALGNLLLNRTLDEWKAELRKLEANKYTDDEKVFGILKVCIDGLRDGGKEIFLDIACFFKGDDKKRAERIFESCGHNPGLNLNILLEKSLVTIVGGKLWMHDLLQETGQKIVIRESKLLGDRSRLWHHKEAISVLKQDKGTSAVRGIFLSSPRLDKVRLKADSFSNMDFLRLLKIKNVIFSGCLEYDLSNELSFLEWHGFPSTSLPSNFEPEKLVELHLPQSQIKQLWKDSMTLPLEKLVIMDLSDCKYLTSTPNFRSVPHLESLILKGCTRLSEVDLPIGDHLQKLFLLNLEGCESLSSLPNGICSLRSLTTLILSGCSKLANLPEKIGENMTQLSELDLDGTAIKELPASIKHLTGLIRLNLRDCKNLFSRPAIICSLTKLQVLNLSGCLKLDELPENLGNLVGLKELDASRTCIRQVPSSILLLKDLESLSFRGCGGLQLPASFSGSLDSLTKLDLSYCKLSDGAIPVDLDCLSSLDHLNLSGNSLVSVPESITKLSKLEVLLLNDCSRLRSLPHLPPSMQRVFARNCPLLGTYSNKLTVWTSTATGFCFINSQTSEEHKLQRIPMTEQRLLRPHLQKFCEDIIYKGNGFEYITPHTKIPSWFDRWSEGSSITIPLPQDYFDGKHELMGFALCFVYEAQEHENMESTASNNLTDEQVKYSCNYSCHLSTCGDPHDDCPLLVCNLMDHDYIGSFRHCVYIAGGLFAERLNNRYVRAEVIIDRRHRPGVEVKECGASLIYSGGVTEFVWNLNLRDESPSHMTNQWIPSDEALMNRLICLYDTQQRNKQSLDHDAGSSSRTGSSTQVPHQRLERPKSNDQSNEQEQGTNSQVTHVVEGGCAADTRLLIEIEPRTSRDDSTSTKIVGDQLETNVESFLEELFELGGKARSHEIGFLFSLRAILPWFKHQSIGNAYDPVLTGIRSRIGLPFPPELHNNKEWVGFAVYVSFTLPPGVWHEESSYSFFSTLTTRDEYLNYHICFECEDKFNGSHLLLVIHIPRGRIEEQSSQCSALGVEFVFPGVEVEIFGIRVVYEQDLKGLIQTITQCTIRSPLAVYNGHVYSNPRDRKLSFTEAYLNENLIEAAKSSERKRSTLQEPLRDSKLTFISGQQIHLTIEAGTPYFPVKNKDLVVEWKRNLELLLKCFFSFSDLWIDLTLNCRQTSFSREFSGIFLQKEIPEWFTPQHPSESVVSALPPNLENDVNFMGLVVCAAFSVHASKADVLKYLDSGHHAQLKFHFQFSSSDGSYGSIYKIFISPENEFMWLYRRGFIWQHYVPGGILKDVLHKDTSVKVSCRTDSISSTVLGVQKCTFRILYKQDVQKLKQTTIQCFTSFFDNEDIIPEYIIDDALSNYGTTCSSGERESCGTTPLSNYGTTCSSGEQESCGTTRVCQGETSEKSNDPDLPFFIEIEPPASSTKITGQPRRNIESLLGQLFQLGDEARHYHYGFILSPRVGAVMPWFSHHSFGSCIAADVPLDLYKDKKWVGFSLYVAFTELCRGPTVIQCTLWGKSDIEVRSRIGWDPEEFSGSQRRLCFIHIPRAHLPKQSFGCKISAGFFFEHFEQIGAGFELSPQAALVVEMCGIRVVYDEDVKGLIQTITESTVRSPPVFFSLGDKTEITPQGHRLLHIPMAISLIALSKDCIRPTLAWSSGLVPSQKFGKVMLEINTQFIEKVTIEWKRNLELFLQSFFRFDIFIKLYLGETAVAYYKNSLDDSYLFPQMEIPDWFTEKSLPSTLSTFMIRLPDDLESDNNWMGFVVCVSFSVHPHPTDVGNYKDSQLTSDVTCNLRWTSDSSQFFSFRKHLVHARPNTKFRWLSRRGFIWLQFISCEYFRIAMKDNKSHRQLEASFESGSSALAVQKCSLRILYKQDVQEYKQTIIQCFASVFDYLDHSQPYNEDDDSQHNKEPIHEDDQIDSVGTTSLSEDTQPETKARVLVPQSETSGNSFNRFNSILFEPILYDNKSAVIFADFRGWEE